MSRFKRFSNFRWGGRRRLRPVGQTLERGRKEGDDSWRTRSDVKAFIILALFGITFAAFPRGEVYEYAVQVGDTWLQPDLFAPFDFAIYKPDSTLARERREVRLTTPPFYQEITDARAGITANRDTVAQQLNRIFDAYESFLMDRSRGRLLEAVEDSLRYIHLRRNGRVKLTADQWDRLVNSYVDGLPGLVSSTRGRVAPERLDRTLLSDAWDVAVLYASTGVLDQPLDSVYTDVVTIRNEQERTERIVNTENLFGLNNAYASAQRRFEAKYGADADMANITNAFFRAIFQPSLAYMRTETLREWGRKRQRISPTTSLVSEGTIIVRESETVTADIKQVLTSLERAEQEKGGVRVLWRALFGQLILILATYILFFIFLYLTRRSIFDDNKHILLIALLFAFIIGPYALAIRLPYEAMYAVPVAIVAVFLTVIFDSRVGILGTLTMALIGAHMLNFDFEFMFATLFAGTLGVFSVRDVRNRSQFFISAGIVLAGYLVIIGASYLMGAMTQDRLWEVLLLVGINAFLFIICSVLLWVIERAFGVVTDLTLLELSDTNRPLLKELSMRAPGSFNHSLQVANLAEAAATAIGANALLTRVGALYHDVGKMVKPEYFVENQRSGFNPHEKVKPRMSALVIANHVKEGIELAKSFNLPKPVLDFIPMHHGTTRIEYFYRKALAESQETNSTVLESEFRYPGPRPNTKETAILMLSDAVEAASKSLEAPTHKRLEGLIEGIMKARINDGQLDDTELTFRDLRHIKQALLNTLIGIYHVRVRYPGQPEQAAPKEAEHAMQGLEEDEIWDTLEESVLAAEIAEEAKQPERIESVSEDSVADTTTEMDTQEGDTVVSSDDGLGNKQPSEAAQESTRNGEAVIAEAIDAKPPTSQA